MFSRLIEYNSIFRAPVAMIPTAFTKTLNTLDRSTPVTAFLRLLFAVLVMGALAWWMTQVPVALYETTGDARLEINSSTTVVQSSMTGRIVESSLAMGKTVEKGDILVRMDSRPEQLLVREQQVRIASIDPQIQTLRAQITEEESAGVAEQRASASAIEEARQKVREAETPAKAALLDPARRKVSIKQRLSGPPETPTMIGLSLTRPHSSTKVVSTFDDI